MENHQEPSSATSSHPVSTTKSGSAAAALALCLLTASLAGVGGGFLLKSTADRAVISLTKELESARGTFSPEQRIEVEAIELRADFKNVLPSMGIVGALVAGAIGLALGRHNNGRTGMIAGTVTGILAGGLLGSGGGALALIVREALKGWELIGNDGQPDMLKTQLHTMAIHAPTWIAIALAAAIAVAASTSARARAFTQAAGAGIGGWLVAGLLYPMVASFAFPGNDPDLVIPSGDMNRVLWVGLSAAFIGLMMGRTAGASVHSPQAQ